VKLPGIIDNRLSHDDDERATPPKAPAARSAEFTRGEIVKMLASIPDNGPVDDSVTYAGRLAGVCLDGLDLTGVNLARLDCDRSTFRGTILRNCDIGGASFLFSDFTDADVRYVRSGDIPGNDTEADISNFTRANLEGAHLNGFHAEHCQFIDANLRDADMSEGASWGTVFTGADLTNADFTSAQLDRDAFKNAKCIDGIILKDVHWREPNEEIAEIDKQCD
jgi:uncharacterized protein YjbI with pentapeptide repeats